VCVCVGGTSEGPAAERRGLADFYAGFCNRMTRVAFRVFALTWRASSELVSLRRALNTPTFTK